jgi:hypothetical protein
VGRRVFPAVLVVAALVADAAGAHGLARNALLAALPFAAVAALVVFGDYVESREAGSGLRALCWGTTVCLLVLSCAIRSGAVHGVPRLAISSLVVVAGLLALELGVTALRHGRRAYRFRPAKP